MSTLSIPSRPGSPAPVSSTLAWVGVAISALAVVVFWGLALAIAVLLLPKTLESVRDFGMTASSSLGRAAAGLSELVVGGAAPGWLWVVAALAGALVGVGALGRSRPWRAAAVAAVLAAVGLAISAVLYLGMLDLSRELAARLDAAR